MSGTKTNLDCVAHRDCKDWKRQEKPESPGDLTENQLQGWGDVKLDEAMIDDSKWKERQTQHFQNKWECVILMDKKT